MRDTFPAPTAADGAAMFEADENGRAVVCEVDELEVRATGLVPPTRSAGDPLPLIPLDDPDVVAAGARLVERGLALAERTPRSAIIPQGGLLAWFTGASLTRPHVVVDQRLPHGRTIRRDVAVATAQLPFPMALVQRMLVPPDAGPGPLPIVIEAVRPDVLVDELADAALAPVLPAPGGEGAPAGVTLRCLTQWKKAALHLSCDSEHTMLYERGKGLRHVRSVTPKVGPEALRNMLTDLFGRVGTD